jgi:tripartite-type tricarboxylate transporter receptor subunit TctC
MAAGLAAATMFAAPVLAQDAAYPAKDKTVHIMLGFGAGGGTDIAARLLADALEKKLGGTFVVENYPGGGGLQALTRVIPAEPDGYTLAFVPIPASNMLYLDPERGGDFTLDDLTVIAMHDYGTIAVAVAANSPYQDLGDLIEAAKTDSSITAASNGALAAGHLGLLLLNKAAGINLNWTAITEPGLLMSSLLGGHIQVTSDTYSELYPAAENGDIRFLAAFSDDKTAVEGVPSAREQGVDVVFSTNRVLIGPKGLPDNVVSTLEKAIGEITSDPEYQKQAAERAVQIQYLNSADATALWKQFDETFKPLVDDFRAQTSK